MGKGKEKQGAKRGRGEQRGSKRARAKHGETVGTIGRFHPFGLCPFHCCYLLLHPLGTTSMANFVQHNFVCDVKVNVVIENSSN